MAARLAALGALGALGAEGTEQSCRAAVFLAGRPKLTVARLCFGSCSFGVEGFQKFLPAKEVQGQVELRGSDLSSERRPQR